jgi:hypothetical protein
MFAEYNYFSMHLLYRTLRKKQDDKMFINAELRVAFWERVRETLKTTQ